MKVDEKAVNFLKNIRLASNEKFQSTFIAAELLAYLNNQEEKSRYGTHVFKVVLLTSLWSNLPLPRMSFLACTFLFILGIFMIAWASSQNNAKLLFLIFLHLFCSSLICLFIKICSPKVELALPHDKTWFWEEGATCYFCKFSSLKEGFVVGYWWTTKLWSALWF